MGFASSTALHSFLESPGTIMEGVRVAVHNAPLLANMLGLTGSSSNLGQLFGAHQLTVMPHIRQIMQLFEVPLKVDAETQTPTHFVDKNIDVNYAWNEWALRRRVSEFYMPEGGGASWKNEAVRCHADASVPQGQIKLQERQPQLAWTQHC